LSKETALTRFFTWSPARVDFVSLHGRFSAKRYPKEAVFHQHTYLEDEATKNIVPRPGHENFRFNLWLNQSQEPKRRQAVEVVISDFEFTPWADDAAKAPRQRAAGTDQN
jgi:hypothetical protein